MVAISRSNHRARVRPRCLRAFAPAVGGVAGLFDGMSDQEAGCYEQAAACWMCDNPYQKGYIGHRLRTSSWGEYSGLKRAARAAVLRRGPA